MLGAGPIGPEFRLDVVRLEFCGPPKRARGEGILRGGPGAMAIAQRADRPTEPKLNRGVEGVTH